MVKSMRPTLSLVRTQCHLIYKPNTLSLPNYTQQYPQNSLRIYLLFALSLPYHLRLGLHPSINSRESLLPTIPPSLLTHRNLAPGWRLQHFREPLTRSCSPSHICYLSLSSLSLTGPSRHPTTMG